MVDKPKKINEHDAMPDSVQIDANWPFGKLDQRICCQASIATHEAK